MADDWIKMRASLLRHSKVIAMARILDDKPEFRAWFSPNGTAPCVTDRYGALRNALRYIVTSALLALWSEARAHGVFDGNDLVLRHNTVDDLDEMAGVPGIGEALIAVGWATTGAEIRLCNFKSYNVPRSAAERQKAYRARAKEQPETRVTDRCAPLRNRYALETELEEETEHKKDKTPKPPKGAATSDPPKRQRKQAAADTDPRVKVFIDWFVPAFKRKLGRAYIIRGGKEGNLVKDLLKAFDTAGDDDPLDELKTAALHMLTDDWGKDHASIGVLSSQINRWRAKPPPDPDEIPEWTPEQWKMVRDEQREYMAAHPEEARAVYRKYQENVGAGKQPREEDYEVIVRELGYDKDDSDTRG